MNGGPVPAQARVRGLPIAYYTVGAEHLPVVLCLHGFLDHGSSFAPIAEALRDRWRFVLVDFRGHGASGWIGSGGYYHFPDYTTDALAVIRAVGAERFSILAHSMGGSVASFLAATLGSRVEAMVLLEGMGPPEEDLTHAPDRLRRWTEALIEPGVDGDVEARRAARRPMKSVEEAIARMQRTNPRLSTDRARALVLSSSEPHGDGIVWRFDPLHRTPSARPFNRVEMMSFFRRVEQPVLSLYGDATEWALPDLAERHRALSAVRVGVVEGAGHNVHHDRPDVVTRAVATWFGGDRHATIEGVRPPGAELEGAR